MSAAETPTTLLRALGVRLRRVADLDEGAIYFVEDRLLLIDFEMDDDGVRECIDEILPSAFM